MKHQWKKLVACIALPLAVGALSSLLTRDAMSLFAAAEKPPLSPPGWLFPIVWTVLYILMGIACYLIWTSGKPNRAALGLYAAQLFCNFVWPLLFFHLQAFLLSFFWLVLLWILILQTAIAFSRISKPAGYLLIPYLLWVTFAGYLNLDIFLQQ